MLEHFAARKLSFSGTSVTMDSNSLSPQEAFHLDRNNGAMLVFTTMSVVFL
jgi:hypothetical protein